MCDCFSFYDHLWVNLGSKHTECLTNEKMWKKKASVNSRNFFFPFQSSICVWTIQTCLTRLKWVGVQKAQEFCEKLCSEYSIGPLFGSRAFPMTLCVHNPVPRFGWSNGLPAMTYYLRAEISSLSSPEIVTVTAIPRPASYPTDAPVFFAGVCA